VHKIQNYALLSFELLPFVNFHTLFLSGPFLLNCKGFDLKLHRVIDLFYKKCSAQKLVLWSSYLFIFEFLPFVNFHILFLSRPLLLNYNLNCTDMKLHTRMIDLIEKKCSHKIGTIYFMILELFSFVDYNILFLSQPFHLNYICPSHVTWTIKAMDLKLHTLDNRCYWEEEQNTRTGTLYFMILE
jgi:hypothetical protein